MALQGTITYGAFTFPYSKLDVSSGVLYDRDGFTRIGTRYVFNVVGWIGGTTQDNLQTIIQTMESTLRQPRLAFKVQWSGDGESTLYSFDNTGSDLDWGPKPGELRITEFTGGRAAMYSWSVVVISNSMQCASALSDVLSIVWTFQHDIDPNGFTTRTISGHLLIDSNQVQQGVSADHYRGTITNVIPVPLWFQRTAQNFSQSEDGRVVSFSIVDTERYWTFPKPVTGGEVSWSVNVPDIWTTSAMMVEYTLSGWYETSAAHTKSELLTCVFNLAAIKFGSLGGDVIPGQRTITESVYGSRISFSISARAAAGTSANGEIDYNVGLATFALAPPGSDGSPLLINPYGQSDNLTSGVVAASPVQYDACSSTAYQFAAGGTAIQAGSVAQNGSGGSGGQAGAQQQPVVKGVSDTQQKNPYIAFHEVVSFELDNGIRVFRPKVAGIATIAQQASAPLLRIVQAGYFKQIAKTANDLQAPPKPTAFGQNNSSGNVVVESAYISPATPDPASDGSVNIYTVHWRYVMTWLPPLGDASLTDVEPQFPSDPRRPVTTGAGGNGGDLPQLPQIAVIPTS